MAADPLCRKWVGPVWKLGGETCVCKLRADHSDGQFGADHECTCGAWFIDADAHPPSVPSTKEPTDP
jgi:hypothetical protein